MKSTQINVDETLCPIKIFERKKVEMTLNTRHQNVSKTKRQNGTKKNQHFFPNAYRSLLYIQFIAVAF